MIFKTQLHALMKSSGITAAELARRSGVSKQVISLWLSGSEPKRIEQVQKVAKEFGVSIEELCFGPVTTNDEKETSLVDSILGTEWVTGIFEVKLRRIKK